MADTTTPAGGPLELVSTSRQPTTTRKPRIKHKASGKGKGKGKRKNPDKTTPQPTAPVVDPYGKLVNAMTTERYGPAEAALRRQQMNVPSAFDSYRALLGGIAARQQGMYGQALQGLGQFGNTLANGAQGLLAATGQAQADGAAVTGATPSAQVSQDAAKAAIVRQGSLGSLGGLIANQGAAQGSYLGNLQANSGMAQFQAQAAANAALADLKQQKGAYRVQARDKLVAADADAANQAFKDKIALEALGINAANTAADNKRADKSITITHGDKVATRRADRRKFNNTPTKYGPTNKEWAHMTPAERKPYIDAAKRGGGSGNGGRTPAQRRADRVTSNKAISRINDVVDRLPDYYNATVTEKASGKKRKPTESEIRNRLRSNDHFTSEEIDIAVAIYRGKPLTPHQRAVAHRLGIGKIPGHWKKGHSTTVDVGPVKVKVPPTLNW